MKKAVALFILTNSCFAQALEQNQLFISSFCELVHARIYYEKRLKNAINALKTLYASKSSCDCADPYPCDAIAYLDAIHCQSPQGKDLVLTIQIQRSLEPLFALWDTVIVQYKELENVHLQRDLALIVITILRNCLLCIAPKQKLPLIIDLFDHIIHMSASQLLDSVDDFVHCFLSFDTLNPLGQIYDPFDYFGTTQQHRLDVTPYTHPADYHAGAHTQASYTELLATRYYLCKQLKRTMAILEQKAEHQPLEIKIKPHAQDSSSTPLFSCPIIEKYAHLLDQTKSVYPLFDAWQDFTSYRCIQHAQYNQSFAILVFLALKSCCEQQLPEHPLTQTLASVPLKNKDILSLLPYIKQATHALEQSASSPASAATTLATTAQEFSAQLWSMYDRIAHWQNGFKIVSYKLHPKITRSLQSESLSDLLHHEYAPQTAISATSYLLYAHYYFLARMRPSIQKLKHGILSYHMIPEAQQFTHPIIQALIQELQTINTTEPLLALWEELRSFTYFDDTRLVREFAQLCCLFLQRLDANTLYAHDHHKHFSVEISPINQLPTCPLLEKAIVRTYITKRIAPVIQSICQSKFPTGLPSLPWQNPIIAQCAQAMEAQQNVQPFTKLSDQFKQFYALENTEFLYQFLQLTAIILHTHGTERSMPTDTQELLEALENLPLEKLLDVIEMLYHDVPDWAERLEFNGTLSWKEWFKKYWWGPPIAIAILLLKVAIKFRTPHTGNGAGYGAVPSF